MLSLKIADKMKQYYSIKSSVAQKFQKDPKMSEKCYCELVKLLLLEILSNYFARRVGIT